VKTAGDYEIGIGRWPKESGLRMKKSVVQGKSTSGDGKDLRTPRVRKSRILRRTTPFIRLGGKQRNIIVFTFRADGSEIGRTKEIE
jgi:hypothetical protein